MTNETMAILIQDGDKSLYGALWGRIYRLICKLCNNVCIKHSGRMERLGLEYDDLIQESYFAFLDAVRGYQPDSGYKFTVYLKYPFMTHINELLQFRTTKQRGNAGMFTIPLQTEIDDTGHTIAELIPDPKAEEVLYSIDVKDWNTALHAACIEAMKELPPPQQKVLQGIYFHDKTQGGLAEEMNVHRSYI